MFKKSDPWQAGLKMVSKFLGFDTQQDNQINSTKKGTNGLLSMKSNIQNTSLKNNEPKSFQLRQKWRRLMKFPSKSKYNEIIQLLKQGSAMEQQTWVWIMKNTQKISPQLYSQKKQQFHQIIYSKNLSNQQINLPISNQQIQDFQDPSSTVYGFNSNKQRKRKFSITKNGVFLRNPTINTGRASFNSQGSTFGSNTHYSNQLIQPQTQNQSSIIQTMFCTKNARYQSPQNIMKSSFMSSQSSPVSQPFQVQQPNIYSNSTIESISNMEQLKNLPQKINHPILTSIIGAFLIHRQDIPYSITLFNIAATFYYYTNSSQIKTFILLNHAACSQFFVEYLTGNWEQSGRIISYIIETIRKKCPCAVYLRNFKLQNFIQNWLFGFLYSICENGSEIKQKMMGYLLINEFSVQSLIRLSESIINSLSKIINQRHEDKIYQCLQNPKYFIDKNILFNCLLRVQQ